MTELEANIYGNWYEVGATQLPSTSRMWSPSAWINKGVLGANVADTTSSTRLKQAAVLDATTTPLHSNIGAGFSTDFISAYPLFIVPTPTHPRQPVFIYKQQTADLVSGQTNQWYPTTWHSGSAPIPSVSQSGTVWPQAQQPLAASVPVPLGGDFITSFDAYYGKAMEATTSDHGLVIWDPWHDEMWELWLFQSLNTISPLTTHSVFRHYPTWTPPAGWTVPADGYFYGCEQIGYAGHLIGTSPSGGDGVMRGSLTRDTLTDNSFACVGAAGLSLGASHIRMEDLFRGVIPHAIYVSINCGIGHIAPAISDDFTPARSWISNASNQIDFSLEIPEGAVFAIDPSWPVPPVGDKITDHPELNAEALGSTTGARVTLFHQMVWTAMRDYGIVIGDATGGGIAMGIDQYQAAGTPYSPYTLSQVTARRTALGFSSTAPNPFGGPGNAFGTAPWSLLRQVTYPY